MKKYLIIIALSVLTLCSCSKKETRYYNIEGYICDCTNNTWINNKILFKSKSGEIKTFGESDWYQKYDIMQIRYYYTHHIYLRIKYNQNEGNIYDKEITSIQTIKIKK